MQYAVSDVTPHERYKLLISFVLPRPIAWVTTIGPTGVVNAAPFSFFNVFAEDPPLIMFAINKRPDGRHQGHLGEHRAHRRVRRQSHRRAAGAGDARFERRLSARHRRARLSRAQDRAVGRHQAAAARRRAVGDGMQDLAGPQREGRPPAGDRRGRCASTSATSCGTPRRCASTWTSTIPVGRMFADRYCRTDDRMVFPAAPVVKAKAAE